MGVPQLVKVCTNCDGLGFVLPFLASATSDEPPGTEWCHNCGGTGEAVTDFGLMVADFVARYGDLIEHQRERHLRRHAN